MSPFPRVDPIPLPAPVELFKLLEMLTVSLHFLAVQALLGCLLVASIWSVGGKWKRSAVLTDAAGGVSQRLPIIMTYVINLGVPPLLFAQVLYGRALYTSSVLIGVYWIGVILLLMAGYTLLYVITSRSAAGMAWGWFGLLAFLVIVKIALIYTSNMTLMLRPQVWVEMYRNDPHGLHLNTGDPTVMPRWLFMIAGGLSAGGVAMMFFGMKKSLAAETTEFTRRWGARLAIAGVVGQAATGVWVVAAQPEGVWQTLRGSPIYMTCLAAWVIASAALAVTAFLAQQKTSPNWRLTCAAGVLVFAAIACWTVFRGGIRDVTLAAYGFDVWDRQVVSNWIVVSAFLVLFVLALGVLFWLGTVVARASAVRESYALSVEPSDGPSTEESNV